MRVLSFSTHVLWPTHHETELELIQGHLDAGDVVTQAVCERHLPACDVNPRHLRTVCALCVTKRREGMKRLSKRVRTIPLFGPTPANEREIGGLATDFATADELKSCRIDNFDAGYAVASSLISQLRTPRLDTVRHRRMIRDYLLSAVGVYRSAQNILDALPVDRVYVFNARFAHTRAILRACQSRRVGCLVHERGHDIFHYQLFPNVLPHDLEHAEAAIRAAWAKAQGTPDPERIGAQFYLERAGGKEQSWYSFTGSQTQGLLPADWNAAVRNVVVFNSSEDEFAALGSEWRNPLYSAQIDAIRSILASLEARGGGAVHLTLRMHPNNRSMAKSELDTWYGLRSPLLTIVPHDAPIDSYALLRNADTVLTFGSTVGIEAVFWGKPSVLAGLSTYRNLGGTYNPASHEEVVQLLTTPLAPKDRLPAIVFGYFMSTFGIPFRHYAAEGVGSGRFKGTDLNKVRPSRLVFGRMLLRELLGTGA